MVDAIKYLKILMIEDNAGDARLMREMLFDAKTVQFELVHVETIHRALEELKAKSFDAVLLDLLLPDGHGIDSVLKINAVFPNMPIVVTSGNRDEKMAIETVQKGAQDYIVKGQINTHLLVRSIQYAIERNQLKEKLHNVLKSQEATVTELAVLYKISSVINRTMGLKKLFANILNTITEIELFKVERKGGIFIVQGDNMTLVSHLGHSQLFLDKHKDMKVGTCLCGLAAKTGEIIVSNNVTDDRRHAIKYPDITPHGHIVIPLKVANRVLGVLYLYTQCNSEVDEKTINMLIAIGNQIGIAIDNAMLYEQTKALSLQDPLTKLANRNLMNVELEKSFARSKRFETPLSIIIMDLDNFKNYNDTHGHIAGDKLLVETANILTNEVRTIDLVVRYGGEEFLIILPDTEITKAREVAERIRKTTEITTGITISLGISAYQHGKTQKVDDVLKKADDALYQAKQKGKNRVEVSD